jgi:hypothetical protein
MNEGLQHIHNVMHVFIEGIAAGMYESLEDIQCDACEYLAMERAVKKLSNWNADSKIEDLENIFEGISNSMEAKRARQQEQAEWASLLDDMPKLGEENVK